MMKKLLLCSISAMLTLTSLTTSAQDQQLTQGKALFGKWCVACHGTGPGHPGTQALDQRYQGSMPGALEQRTNLSPEFVAVFVRNGISVMPFFRKTEINDNELAAIGAYLSSPKGTAGN